MNVLTTERTAAINEFHHRSPVIIGPEHAHQWLRAGGVAAIAPLLQPYSGTLLIYACDGDVDNARHDGPQCMQPFLRPR